MVPRVSSSLRILAQERIDAAQSSSRIEEILRPRSSSRACSPAFGKVGDKLQVCLEMPSSTEFTSRMAYGETAMRQ